MKTKITFLLLACFACSFSAFSQAVYHGNFETWVGNPAHPVDWSSTESAVGISDNLVIRDAANGNFVEGLSSARLTTDTLHTPFGAFLIEGDLNYGPGVFSAVPQPHVDFFGTPFTWQPDSITFKYKMITGNTDSAAFNVSLTKWDGNATNLLASHSGVNYLLTTDGNWISVRRAINYSSIETPDSIHVQLHSSYQLGVRGTKIWFDDLKLVYNTVGVFESTPVRAEMGLYPNPASALLCFTPGIIPAGSVIHVFDLEGRLVLQTVAEDNSINVSTLQNGNYILRLKDQSGSERTGRFELMR